MKKLNELEKNRVCESLDGDRALKCYSGAYKETTIKSVIIDKEFKNVVFLKIDERYFIVIGKEDNYSWACGMTGIAALNSVSEEWFETTKEEGNGIYGRIKKTERLNKNGKPYYRFEVQKWLLKANL